MNIDFMGQQELEWNFFAKGRNRSGEEMKSNYASLLNQKDRFVPFLVGIVSL